MTAEALAQQLERDPFVPLRLRLDDGQTVEIRNPDAAFISNLLLYVFHARRTGGVIADDSRLISLLHIVSRWSRCSAREPSANGASDQGCSDRPSSKHNHG